MADDLDDEERELIEKHRAERAKAAEDDRDVWIKQGDNEGSLPYSKAKSWFQKAFGIDLDDEPVQDDKPEKPAKPAAKDAKPGSVTAFGRRVS